MMRLRRIGAPYIIYVSIIYYIWGSFAKKAQHTLGSLQKEHKTFGKRAQYILIFFAEAHEYGLWVDKMPYSQAFVQRGPCL